MPQKLWAALPQPLLVELTWIPGPLAGGEGLAARSPKTPLLLSAMLALGFANPYCFKKKLNTDYNGTQYCSTNSSNFYHA